MPSTTTWHVWANCYNTKMSITGLAYVCMIRSTHDTRFFQGHVVTGEGTWSLVGTPCAVPAFVHACCVNAQSDVRYFHVVARDDKQHTVVDIAHVCDDASG